jgi:hypothetical protein
LVDIMGRSITTNKTQLKKSVNQLTRRKNNAL